MGLRFWSVWMVAAAVGLGGCAAEDGADSERSEDAISGSPSDAKNRVGLEASNDPRFELLLEYYANARPEAFTLLPGPRSEDSKADVDAFVKEHAGDPRKIALVHDWRMTSETTWEMVELRDGSARSVIAFYGDHRILSCVVEGPNSPPRGCHVAPPGSL